LPASNLYHVISSVRITFPKPGEALHQSSWQTVRRDKDGRMIAAAMGRSEDRLVKRNGKWLIPFRKLPSSLTDALRHSLQVGRFVLRTLMENTTHSGRSRT
jgi:hypothetical protein